MTGWRKYTLWLGRLALAWLLSFGLGGRPASGQTAAAWSTPTPLSPEGEYAWFPDILADWTGRLHVVYASGARAGRTLYDAVLYTSLQPDGTWSLPNDIAVVDQGPNGESAATRPTLLADATNTLHLTYTDYFHVFYKQAPAEAAASVQGWNPARDLGSNNPVYFSRLAADHQGRLHLLYTENVYNRSCPQCYHVFHRLSDDAGATWSPPLDISLRAAGSAKVQMVIDQQDNLYAVWETGRGGSYGGLEMETRLQFSASYDRGQTWTAPFDPSPRAGPAAEVLAPTPAAGQPEVAPTPEPRAILKNITIGQDGSGQLVIVWLGLPEDLIYSQVSRDGGRSWSEPAPIPGMWGGMTLYNTRLDDYTLAADSAGRLHLLAVGRLQAKTTTLHVLHVTWDGSAWSAPESVAQYVGDVPEWPRLTTRLGNSLHAVWFVRNAQAIFGSDSGAAQYRVWYAERPLDTALVQPTLQPRRTATPGPTPSPAGPAVATAAATATRPILVASPQPLEPYGEANYLLIAGISLVPVVVLIVIVVVVTQWRRR